MLFIFNSILIGTGLAIDAFSISMANGLQESKMKLNKMFLICTVFSAFQSIMPLISYVIGNTFFNNFFPYIQTLSFVVLFVLGAKMLLDCFKNKYEDKIESKLTFHVILLQGIATSIDALSVGFSMVNYNFVNALISIFIIFAITFIICFIGIIIGKSFGTKLERFAEAFGGIILIIISIINIFIK